MGFFSKSPKKQKTKSLFGSTTTGKSKTKSSHGSGLFSKATTTKKSSPKSKKKNSDKLLNDIQKKVVPKVKVIGQKVKKKSIVAGQKIKERAKPIIEKGKSKGKDLVSRGSSYLKSKLQKKQVLQGEPNKDNVLEKDKKPDMLKYRAEKYKKELKVEKKEPVTYEV